MNELLAKLEEIEFNTGNFNISDFYKNNKEEKDVNVAINKKATNNAKATDVMLKYWVFDSESERPTSGNMKGSIYSQYAMQNPFTIEKMKRGDVKYVWITEKSNNDLYKLLHYLCHQ